MINGYSVLNSAKYFAQDGSQNYLVFQPLLKYFEGSRTTVDAKVMTWRSKRLLDESIKFPATSHNSLSPTLDYFNNLKFQVEFNGSCLKADKVSFTPNKIINVHIAFEIKSQPFYAENGFTLRNFFFRAVKLTTNPDPDGGF